MKMSLNRFETKSLIYSYNKRKKFDLFIIGHNTKLFKQRSTHNGVLIFNKLYSEIKKTMSL
jgi:hypothetical protein